MAETATRLLLAQVVLTNALADVYTAPTQPPNAFAFVQALFIANNAAAGHTFTLRLGPPGATTNANSLFETNAIAANTTIREYGSEWTMIIPAGWHIQGLADANSVIVVTLFGAVIT